ncbi:MAG: protein kinase [Nannocystaceae bacterium]
MHHLAQRVCPQCHARVVGAHRYCPDCATDLTEVSALAGDAYIGTTLADRYLLREHIGQGAMGRVYRAEQLSLRKSFAVKILHPHLIHDPESHARFADEARNAASLNHPNVVSVVDYGRTPDGMSYLVMELIDGQSLEEAIKREFPFSRNRTIDLTLQMLAALTEAHGLSILHRDLKPENILIQSLRTHGELLKVLDFGIAKLMDNGTGPQAARLTNQGTICGTPEYMSPEQARGSKLDARSDIYAVGVVLYQMLTGRVPFCASSPIEVLHQHMHEAPVAPSEVVGEELGLLEAICLRALAKQPRDRFATATEFRETLIAASRDVDSAASMCNTCASEMGVDARYCPTCGTPRAVSERTEAASHPTLKLGQAATSMSGRTAECMVGSFPLPLTGRSALLDPLKERLFAPPSEVVGQVVRGERGMGRSRLLQEAADMARGVGWRVLATGSEPRGCSPPLWPVRQLVAAVLDLELERLTTQDLGRASNLIGLTFEALPGLAELFELQGPATHAEYAVRRRECFAASNQALCGAGHGRPLLLIFDDIDRYDTASRHVLQQLLKPSTREAVLVLMSTAEADTGWLNAEVAELEPLGSSDVLAIAQPIAADINPDSTLPDYLAASAPLSPLRLELELWLQALDLPRDPQAPNAALVELRLDVMGPSARAVLQAAAVLGERISERELEHLIAEEAATDIEELLPALDELHGLGLLLAVAAGERRFSNRLIRTVAYEDCDSLRRRKLHRLAATQAPATQGPSYRAMHAVRGNSPDLVDALEQAAAQAVRLFDDRKAMGLYRTALRFIDQAETSADRDSDARVRRKLARLLGSTHVRHDRVDAAESLFVSAGDAGTKAVIQHALGRALSRAGAHGHAVEAFKRCLRPLIAQGDRKAILQIYGELGRSYNLSGDFDSAVSELQEGLDMCTLGEGPRATTELSLWRYILGLGQLMRGAKRLREARTWCEHALHQAERLGDDLGRLRCHTEMAWILRELKQPTLAETHLARALEHARYFGDRLTTAEILLERARLRLSRNRFMDARRCFGEALRLARVVDWREGMDHAQKAIRALEDQRAAHPSI